MQNTRRNHHSVEAKIERRLLTMVLVVNTIIALFMLAAFLPTIF
jgi:hypothetical protein